MPAQNSIQNLWMDIDVALMTIYISLYKKHSTNVMWSGRGREGVLGSEGGGREGECGSREREGEWGS